MPATALAAMSTSIEGATPQHIVPVPIGLDIVIIRLQHARVQRTEQCQTQEHRPASTKDIRESAYISTIHPGSGICGSMASLRTV
jgi:hypothetical protein